MKKITLIIVLSCALTAIQSYTQEQCERIPSATIGGIGSNTLQAYSCKQLWHNGAWHDSVLKNGKRGYMMNGKHITLTPTEMSVSNAKEKDLMK